ncbi:nonsense-mediated mRNA decay protein 2-like [Juglans microcarpa x Juglans regia]|uniref:nonsense-mediated mRNA decay protein 2-like n=1 Tax=Juglans microcarpa x Juglans regia TaxID=2249226 RepID=UPI001B7E3D65|nr:nonsense-mediated mRNA decay protein 2-like [Juglans microcarpa x Juglans regia]
MKSKASLFFKQFISVFKSIAKAKSMAIKNKTSAVKARLIMFSLLKNKQSKLMLDSLSHKIHRLLGQHDGESQDEAGENSKAIVLYNSALANEYSHSSSSHTQYLMHKVEADYEEEGRDHDDGDDKYPDLRHSLFDDEDLDFEEDGQGGSIIDLVRNSKEEEGENFVLEDEIDNVADLFIRRFYKQIRLQKLQSFKRFQAMMERSL